MNLPQTRINLYAPPSVLLLKDKTCCSLPYNNILPNCKNCYYKLVFADSTVKREWLNTCNQEN